MNWAEELSFILQERVKEITFGYVPNPDDFHEILWNNAILIIQRKPDDLHRHRVCLHTSTISVSQLRTLVEAEWKQGREN